MPLDLHGSTVGPVIIGYGDDWPWRAFDNMDYPRCGGSEIRGVPPLPVEGVELTISRKLALLAEVAVYQSIDCFFASFLILGAKYKAEIIVGKAIKANMASTIFTAKSNDKTDPRINVKT